MSLLTLTTHNRKTASLDKMTDNNDIDEQHNAQDHGASIDNKEEEKHTESLSKEEKEARQAMEAMRKFTDENEEDSDEFSLKAIIGGDFLMSKFVIRQILFVVFLVMLAIIYTGNRYDSQKDAIVIDSLRTELQSVKYNVLTQSSELMNMIRQSNVEERLKHTKDSLLHNSSTPPFLIKINEEEVEETAAPETREVVIGEKAEQEESPSKPEDGTDNDGNGEVHHDGAATTQETDKPTQQQLAE